MEQQTIQEFNSESGQWDTVPPEPASEPKPAELPLPADDANDAPAPPKAAAETKPETPEKPRNRRDDPKVAVQTAVNKQREAERRAADAERRAEEAERRAAERAEPRKEPAKSAPDAFPSFEKWLGEHPEASESDDPLRDYNRAFYTSMRTAERAQEAEQRDTEQIEQSFQTRAGGFSTKYSEAISADPDLAQRIDPALLSVRPYSALTKADKDLIRRIPDPRERDLVAFRCFLADQWIDSDHAIALLEHVSDPNVFQRLASLPPAQVVREIARFEASRGAAPAEPASKAKPHTSKAAPPITPLGSSPHVPDDSPQDEDDDETWRRKEEARLRRQRRGRG